MAGGFDNWRAGSGIAMMNVVDSWGSNLTLEIYLGRTAEGDSQFVILLLQTVCTSNHLQEASPLFTIRTIVHDRVCIR